MAVDRCVCHNRTLTSLRALARTFEPGVGMVGAKTDVVDRAFDELRRVTRCSTSCGMCEPYIRLMLQTGRTRFTVFEGSGT